jgi:hypothetical protein
VAVKLAARLGREVGEAVLGGVDHATVQLLHLAGELGLAEAAAQRRADDFRPTSDQSLFVFPEQAGKPATFLGVQRHADLPGLANRPDSITGVGQATCRAAKNDRRHP